MSSDLPPGVERDETGRLFWIREYTVDGDKRKQTRYVSLDKDEARAKRLDYWDPQLGWILEGYKLARDRSVESIMADGSTATPLSVEEQEKKARKVA